MIASLKSALRSPFAVFTLLMALKFYMASAVIFGELSWHTLASQLPPVWAAFGLIELLFARRKLAAYIAVNLVYTCIYFAVIMYYKYFGIIVTYHALSQIGQVTEVKGSVFQLMHPYFLLIFIDLPVIGALLTWNKRFRKWGAPDDRSPHFAALAGYSSHSPISVRSARFAGRRTWHYRAAFAGLAALSLLLCVLNIRQNSSIVNELKRAERMGIINYEAHVIADAAELEPASNPAAVTPEAVAALKGRQTPDSPVGRDAAAGRHILYIQLEAFQNFLIDLKVDGREVTPVMNGLAREGLYFTRVYQQVGAGNTADAEFTANTSLYTPPAGAASETYGLKSLPSLPKRLHALGYETLTFHTNDVAFWNRADLYAGLGFDRYYDSAFFNDEDLVHFGSSDEVLYRRSADELARLAGEGKRLYANIISMSAHHPFHLPAHKDRMELPEQLHNTFVGDYLRSQNYADYALGQLVDRLKESGLWDNSLIVVYGDHMGLPIYSLSSEDHQLLEELTGAPYGFPQMLNIPLIVLAPGALEPQTIDLVGGHSDIMPTVANLAGVRLDDAVYFGQDLLNATTNLLPLRYYLPSGSFINDRVIYVPGVGYRDGVVYPLPGTGKASLRDTSREQFDRALQLLDMSHSYVQSLPDRAQSGAAQPAG